MFQGAGRKGVREVLPNMTFDKRSEEIEGASHADAVRKGLSRQTDQ